MSLNDIESVKCEKKGHVWFQWLCAFIANLPLLNYALQAGWISPMAPVLQSESTPLDHIASDTDVAWIASVLFLAAAVSPPIYTYIADRYGRKIAAVLISIPHAITWLLILLANNIIMLIIARVLSGIAAGGTYSVMPMYVKEISEDKIRGSTGSLGMIIQSFGFLIIYAMGAFMDYYLIVYVLIGLPILHIFLSFFMPESPSFLIKVGDYKKAANTIGWLRHLHEDDKKVQTEIATLKQEIENYQKLEKLTVKSVLDHKPWRKGLIISLVLHGVRGMGGSLVILSYATIILEKSGASLDQLVQTLAIPAVMIIGMAFALILVDRCGRKPLLFFGCAVMGASLVALGVMIQVQPNISWLPITILAMSIFGYGAGVLSVPYVIMTEIFNMRVRATLLGYIAVYIWLTIFINVQTFGYIETYWGIHIACYIYGVINLIGAIYTIVGVPETKGKSISELEKILENH